MRAAKSVSLTFLWTVRIFGFLPVADRKCSRIFSIVMTLAHSIPTSIMTIWPFYTSVTKEFDIPKSAKFWLYTGMIWQLLYGLAFWINMIELLKSRKKLEMILKHFQTTYLWTSNKHKKKLNQLTCKYSLFFIILLSVSICGNIELAGIQVRQIFVWFYYTMFLILRVFQFSIAFDMIKLELEQINRELVRLNKLKYTIDQAAIRIRLINIREAYERILNLSMMINSTNTYSLLSLSTLMAGGTVCSTYWMVLSLVKNVQILSFLSFFCTVFPTLCMMLIVVKPCQDCQDLSKSIGVNIHSISSGTENLLLVIQTSSLVSQNLITFTAGGFFTLNFQLIGTLCTTSITYLMILVSLDTTPKEETAVTVDHAKVWDDFYQM